MKAGTVTDADLPGCSRAALVRLDQPLIDFYTAFDAWRDYYAPKVPPPEFVATVPDPTPPTANSADVTTTTAETNATSPSSTSAK